MSRQTCSAESSIRRCGRRRFISAALAGAGALFTGAQAALSAGGPAPGSAAASDLVTLGNTGIRTSRLAQGTGWNGGARSSAHTRLGEKAFDELIRHGLDSGIRLMDLADLYGSHPYARHALAGISRDRYEILTKIWPRTEFWNSASGGAKAEVDRFRKELKSDVLDICLIHCMTNADWPNECARIRDELSELKQQGAVRAVGVSCHDFGALKVASEHPWVDVLLARINNVGKSAAMDASVEEVAAVLGRAKANGKTIIGMKIFGAGKLTAPEQKNASLKFVFENRLVDAITIGMMRPEEVDDTVRRMSEPLGG